MSVQLHYNPISVSKDRNSLSADSSPSRPECIAATRFTVRRKAYLAFLMLSDISLYSCTSLGHICGYMRFVYWIQIGLNTNFIHTNPSVCATASFHLLSAYNLNQGPCNIITWITLTLMRHCSHCSGPECIVILTKWCIHFHSRFNMQELATCWFHTVFPSNGDSISPELPLTAANCILFIHPWL